MMRDSILDILLTVAVPIIVGSVMLYYAWRNGRCAWHSRRWPKVLGLVQQSKVVAVPGESTYYRLAVVYTYEVNGVHYRGERLGFGFNDFWGDGMFSQESDAEFVARDYRPGSPVAVAYDPADHSSAVLKTGLNKGVIVTGIFGAFSLGLCGYGLWNQLSK